MPGSFTNQWLVLMVLSSSVLACTAGGDGPSVPDAAFDARFDTGSDARPVDGGGPEPTIDTCTASSIDSTIGNACAGDTECDDGCFCNGVEGCVGGTCAAGTDPCPDEVSCTADVCLEEVDRCFHDPQHEMCGDGDACNGVEVCDLAAGCRVASPLYCNDENSCTVDACDPAVGCSHVLRDLDGDGFIDGRCGGDDCDDDPRFGRNIYPGATEDCTNRRDDDCDGLRDYIDADCVPANDTCASAELLPGPGVYSGATRGLLDDISLACKTTGPDAVYRFTLTEMQDVRISLSGGGTGAAIALRPWASCATGPDEKCSSTAPATILRRSLGAGDYAIIVKTSSGAPFDLALMFDAPTPIPPVDVCNASTEDVSAGGTFTGMFVEVEDDYRLSCHSSSTSYRDAAYVFTITEEKDVTITASTSAGGFSSTYVSLLTDCADAATTIQCLSASAPMLRRRGLPAGTYYILLESSTTSATTWSLDVTITPPVPRMPADACSSAIDITTTPASVSLATQEFDGGTGCGGTSSFYRDSFFFFDLATTRDVTLTTSSGSFHYVSLGTSCGVTGSEIRCRSGSGTLTNVFRSLPAGRYFVATSTSTSSGTASASITTGPPTPIPPNDRCSGAIEVGGGYSSVDTTIDFEDDLTGCSSGTRPDAFYQVTLAARQRVLISADRVTGTGSLYLTLRNTCGAGTNLACDTGDPGVISQTLDAGTYYLMVETSSFSTAGDYRLDVVILPP
ncbi:MAG: hypothetical protein DRJ42_06915 [Deltaproteobacteria bacterium]|nr:MAG: hypothetical protein DRJ42_06915 [Deltaproteobacteria bacterium]